MVRKMVNVPHGESASALTTAMPSPASAMTMMKRMATMAVIPASGEISVARDLRQRLAVPPHRRREDDEVVHRAAEHDAEGQPQQSRQIPELRRQHRPDQRPRAGDGREVMPEEHPLVGRHVVLPVVEPMRRRDPRVIERHHLRREEGGVVAVADRGDGEEEEDEREGVHLGRICAGLALYPCQSDRSALRRLRRHTTARRATRPSTASASR